MLALDGVVTIWAGGDFENRDKPRQGFVDHYAHVRSVVPKERLLEFESKDGWTPLCKILGKDVPAGPYPRVNDAQATVNLLRGVSRVVLGIVHSKGHGGSRGSRCCGSRNPALPTIFAAFDAWTSATQADTLMDGKFRMRGDQLR